MMKLLWIFAKEQNSNNVLNAVTGLKGSKVAVLWLANVDKSFAMYVEAPLALMEDVLILQKEKYLPLHHLQLDHCLYLRQ